MELRIDPEFASRIPPLTEDEFKQLEENIFADGVVINPIIVWNGVIVDGHNRFQVIQSHPHIQFTTYEKCFGDKLEAIAWICKNQLGRRNLTPEQKKYLIGKQYEAEKHIERFRGNQHTLSSDVGSVQNEQNLTTGQRIAKETKTSDSYVRRAEQFAKGVDLANEYDPSIRQDILSGALPVTSRQVMGLVNSDPQELPVRVAELRNPPPPPPSKNTDSAVDPAGKKDMMVHISDNMVSAQGKATMEDMLYELEEALESFTFRWSRCLSESTVHYEKKKCRLLVQKLVQTGLDFLNKIKNGEIPK